MDNPSLAEYIDRLAAYDADSPFIRGAKWLPKSENPYADYDLECKDRELETNTDEKRS